MASENGKLTHVTSLCKTACLSSLSAITVCRRHVDHLDELELEGEAFFSDDYFGNEIPSWSVPERKVNGCFPTPWGVIANPQAASDGSKDVYAIETLQFLEWIGSKVWFPIRTIEETRLIICFRGKDDAPFTVENLAIGWAQTQYVASKYALKKTRGKSSGELAFHGQFLNAVDFLNKRFEKHFQLNCEVLSRFCVTTGGSFWFVLVPTDLSLPVVISDRAARLADSATSNAAIACAMHSKALQFPESLEAQLGDGMTFHFVGRSEEGTLFLCSNATQYAETLLPSLALAISTWLTSALGAELSAETA